MSRLSYARILVEINLAEDLPQYVKFCLPNGVVHAQPVVYETLPKFCSHCKVLGHLITSCSRAPKDGGENSSGTGAAITAKNGGSVASQEPVAAHASRVDCAGLGSVQPTDPMLVEVDAAAGGWEQVGKKHRSSRHSRKKHSGAAADASAGPILLAEKSKSVADLNGLNSELDVGLAAGFAGESVGNSVGLKSVSVVGLAMDIVVDSSVAKVSVVPPSFAVVQPRLFASSSASLGLNVKGKDKVGGHIGATTRKGSKLSSSSASGNGRLPPITPAP